MTEATPQNTRRGHRKERVGEVVSDAMDKTIVVRVERRIRHALYGKEMRTYSKFHAHDEANEARKGDRVRIVETRPISRMKRWRLLAIVDRAAKEGGAGA
jgi:small subunit ribosomal protein S17